MCVYTSPLILSFSVFLCFSFINVPSLHIPLFTHFDLKRVFILLLGLAVCAAEQLLISIPISNPPPPAPQSLPPPPSNKHIFPLHADGGAGREARRRGKRTSGRFITEDSPPVTALPPASLGPDTADGQTGSPPAGAGGDEYAGFVAAAGGSSAGAPETDRGIHGLFHFLTCPSFKHNSLSTFPSSRGQRRFVVCPSAPLRKPTPRFNYFRAVVLSG